MRLVRCCKDPPYKFKSMPNLNNKHSSYSWMPYLRNNVQNFNFYVLRGRGSGSVKHVQFTQHILRQRIEPYWRHHPQRARRGRGKRVTRTERGRCETEVSQPCCHAGNTIGAICKGRLVDGIAERASGGSRDHCRTGRWDRKRVRTESSHGAEETRRAQGKRHGGVGIARRTVPVIFQQLPTALDGAAEQTQHVEKRPAHAVVWVRTGVLNAPADKLPIGLHDQRAAQFVRSNVSQGPQSSLKFPAGLRNAFLGCLNEA